MKLAWMLLGVLLFFAGVVCGTIIQSNAVLAQSATGRNQKTAPPAEVSNPTGCSWIVQPVNATGFDAYLYNQVTGEAFMLAKTDKVALRQK